MKNTLTIISLVVALIATLAFAAASAQAATPPKRAAKATAACFVQHGWSAKITDHGMTVDAQAPRDRGENAYPRRPWFSVAFSDFGSSTIKMALNRRELKIATGCRATR